MRVNSKQDTFLHTLHIFASVHVNSTCCAIECKLQGVFDNINLMVFKRIKNIQNYECIESHVVASLGSEGFVGWVKFMLHNNN